MTLKIEVTIPEDDVKAGTAPQYLERAMSAIGFSRGVSLAMPTVADTPEVDNTAAAPEAKPTVADAPSEGADNTPARAFLRPEDGKTRRTKAQIAEDNALEEKLRAKGLEPANYDGADPHEIEALADSTEPPKPAISTGEERIDPENPEDEAQDKADEKAEVEATRDGLTLDDLRAAVGDFTKAHGMAATVEHIPAMLGCAVANVKPEDLEAAIAKVRAATAENAEASTAQAAPTATKEDVIEAMLSYAEKFDGQRDKPGEAKFMIEDRAKIFAAAFGDGEDGLSKIPDTPEGYGKAAAAFRAAIENDPYNRGAK
jgi:hypothetical protein